MTSNLFAQVASALASTDFKLDDADVKAIHDALVNQELVDEALSYYGLKEIPGPQSSPTISSWIKKWSAAAKVKTSVNDDQTAWCSIFVNEIAQRCGCETTNKINARSWLDVGDGIPLEDAKTGDVIILWRVKRDGWQGHVGFFIRKGPNVCWILGGNQSNQVNILPFGDGYVLGIRRLRKVHA